MLRVDFFADRCGVVLAQDLKILWSSWLMQQYEIWENTYEENGMEGVRALTKCRMSRPWTMV
jgi:hypothetical protein